MALDEFELEVVRTVRVVVTHYQPAYPGRFGGPPERCEPPEPAEFACEAFDREGRPIALTEEEVEEAQAQYEDRRDAAWEPDPPDSRDDD